MLPELHIFGLTIQTFGLMLALALVSSGVLVGWRLKELDLPVDWVYEIMFCAGVGGIAGAKLWYVIEKGDLGALFSGTGLVFYGGALGGALAVMVYARHRGFLDYRLFDMGAPALAIGYAVGRLGCQLAGDGDYGIPSNLPWAMAYPKGTVPTTVEVHPTPIYEFLVMGALTIWLWRRRDRVQARRADRLVGGAGRDRALPRRVHPPQRRHLGAVQPRPVRVGADDRGGRLVAAAGALARAADASELGDGAEPELLRAAQGEGGRRVVLDRDADGLVERQLLRARAARPAGDELAELDRVLRLLEVGAAGGRRGERRLARLDHDERLAHQRGVELAARGRVADRVDVRARARATRARSTGSVAGVAMQTTVAPATASSTPANGGGLVARGEAAGAVLARRPQTRISAHSRSRVRAWRCASPCTPVPMIASTSPSESSRVASREPAAVRAAVMASPSISAAGVPVAASKTTIAAWCAGSWPG